jgi:hypothetical protein
LLISQIYNSDYLFDQRYQRPILEINLQFTRLYIIINTFDTASYLF